MFKVSDKRCNQCLFTKNKIVSDSRRDEVIKKCLKGDKHFICHKASLVGQDVCCRGFYEEFGRDVRSPRMATILGVIDFVDVEKLEG